MRKGLGVEAPVGFAIDQGGLVLFASVEGDHLALRLRNDLARHDDEVMVFKFKPLNLDRLEQEPYEVVASCNHADTVNWYHAQLVHSSTVVASRDAFNGSAMCVVVTLTLTSWRSMEVPPRGRTRQ